jgi:hypothetical protein
LLKRVSAEPLNAYIKSVSIRYHPLISIISVS